MRPPSDRHNDAEEAGGSAAGKNVPLRPQRTSLRRQQEAHMRGEQAATDCDVAVTWAPGSSPLRVPAPLLPLRSVDIPKEKCELRPPARPPTGR